MNRLKTITAASAAGDSAAVFAKVKSTYGGIPNAYATVGTNAPAVLEHLLRASAILKSGSLSQLEIEAINLAASQSTGCDYFTEASARTALAGGDVDLVSFGAPYVANPDLVERFQQGIPLSSGDPETYYQGGARGYTDYLRAT